ncbi:gamma-glutamylcyclotransferase [Pseudomonas syringae]|uniref:gamma-glutamylcyclotransferase n=1 Tax=Pseudomonas syringae TaxID=317 RepID=UPI00201C7D42|nr:gamma-glutamylcyclotransferase [Pseudomonas syringae]MCL6306936.1 gamma-glutamylcyclotransferase [Pseudomonas syringae]
MWVFGFGSLMADGWEKDFFCIQRVKAELKGYRRVFNKASVSNWGTRDCPCPTLNLVFEANASCVGIAFEFSEEMRDEVEAYLARREGKNFNLSVVEVVAEGSGAVEALVSLYAGRNIIRTLDMQETFKLVSYAKGSSGKCTDYVVDVYEQLKKLDINDPAVTKVRKLLF